MFWKFPYSRTCLSCCLVISINMSCLVQNLFGFFADFFFVPALSLKYTDFDVLKYIKNLFNITKNNIF